MEIKHIDGRFFVGERDAPLAVLDYRFLDAKTVQAYHTETSDTLRGQGIAGKLYDAFIAYVESEDLRVQATCSYIERKMNERATHRQRMV